MTPTRLIATALPALILAACSSRDAANEAPIDLKPGLYSIAATGKGEIPLAGGGDRGQKCLGEATAREFAVHPLRAGTMSMRDCSDSDDPRKGNAISGKRFCKGASFRDDDETVYTYEATIDADGEGYIIRGMTKDKEDGSGPDTGEWRVSAVRTGDC